VLLILAIVGFVLALQWGIRAGKAGIDQIKTTVDEFEKNPAKASAELAVRMNPDLELVSSDPAAESLTFRRKSTGETGTVSYREAAEGRFDAGIGRTQYKPGETVPLPSWVPALPGLMTGTGSMRSVANGRETIRLVASVEQPVDAVAGFYQRALEQAGFTVAGQQQTAGVFATRMLQAREETQGRSLTVSITQESERAATSVVLAAEGPATP
jgi:hypothetical protein